jgi:hypothetical protein
VPDDAEGSVVGCDLGGNALGAWDVRSLHSVPEDDNRE